MYSSSLQGMSWLEAIFTYQDDCELVILCVFQKVKFKFDALI